MEKLIVGLGNYGSKYESTRHNIGWDVFQHLSFSSQLNWKEKFKGLFTTYSSADDKFHFLMPQTYMNLSGESVQPLTSFFKVGIEDILVLHDELDLPFGTIAFKKGGGLAGHNGLKSIAQCMGSQNFLRLRIGIGRPQHGNVSSWVLSKFTEMEQAHMEDVLKECAKAVEMYIDKGFDKAAGQYSRKKIITLE